MLCRATKAERKPDPERLLHSPGWRPAVDGKMIARRVCIPCAIVLMLLVQPGTLSADADASIAGSWSLNTYLSDEPQQIANELRYDTGTSGVELFGGDLGGGGERQGSGRAGSSERAPANRAVNAEDRKKLDELTDVARLAPTMLSISQTVDAVVLTIPVLGAIALHTSGKSEKYQLEAGPVDCMASWEGPELVVAYSVGRAGTLRYTYGLVPGGSQLIVRIGFVRANGERGPFDVKLVYDPAKSTPSPGL